MAKVSDQARAVLAAHGFREAEGYWVRGSDGTRMSQDVVEDLHEVELERAIDAAIRENARPRDKTPVEAGAKWAFDEQVTAVFDDMLERSIPQHGVMRDAVLDVADRFAQPETYVVDLGAARGEATARLLDRRGATLKYSLVETSKPMADALRARFAPWVDNGLMRVHETDLRTAYPPEVCSVVMSVLTLQFVPIEYRLRVLNAAYKKLLPGGALVLVEKVLGASADLDALMVDLYLKKKRASGYSQEEIDRKRLSLEGVLVPVTSRMNEEFMHAVGFRQVDCFWAWQNFRGFIAVKD